MNERETLEKIRQIASDDLGKHGACGALERIEGIAGHALLSQAPEQGALDSTGERFQRRRNDGAFVPTRPTDKEG